jgi:hypothetical protein
LLAVSLTSLKAMSAVAGSGVSSLRKPSRSAAPCSGRCSASSTAPPAAAPGPVRVPARHRHRRDHRHRPRPPRTHDVRHRRTPPLPTNSPGAARGWSPATASTHGSRARIGPTARSGYSTGRRVAITSSSPRRNGPNGSPWKTSLTRASHSGWRLEGLDDRGEVRPARAGHQHAQAQRAVQARARRIGPPPGPATAPRMPASTRR